MKTETTGSAVPWKTPPASRARRGSAIRGIAPRAPARLRGERGAGGAGALEAKRKLVRRVEREPAAFSPKPTTRSRRTWATVRHEAAVGWPWRRRAQGRRRYARRASWMSARGRARVFVGLGVGVGRLPVRPVAARWSGSAPDSPNHRADGARTYRPRASATAPAPGSLRKVCPSELVPWKAGISGAPGPQRRGQALRVAPVAEHPQRRDERARLHAHGQRTAVRRPGRPGASSGLKRRRAGRVLGGVARGDDRDRARHARRRRRARRASRASRDVRRVVTSARSTASVASAPASAIGGRSIGSLASPTGMPRMSAKRRDDPVAARGPLGPGCWCTDGRRPDRDQHEKTARDVMAFLECAAHAALSTRQRARIRRERCAVGKPSPRLKSERFCHSSSSWWRRRWRRWRRSSRAASSAAASRFCRRPRQRSSRCVRGGGRIVGGVARGRVGPLRPQ